ncbi:MAG: methyltransferase [Defluviitaleaceae bacterium]|nr:methyltransferase [Defluviitaleaceae bacterium]MCL2274776.1 methyltransferase [Defluviitaleaceae bacterium]
MGTLRFIWQYITRPRSVGAIAPSSRFLARKMVQGVDFTQAKCIVEFGPGTGVFTRELIARRQEGTVIIAIERNADFCEILRKQFADIANLHIINGSADQVQAYLAERGFSHACYIVSGLPFASLPRELSEAILTQARVSLREGGQFITFQYTLLRKDLIARFFSSIEVKRELRNLPPAYVLRCKI